MLSLKLLILIITIGWPTFALSTVISPSIIGSVGEEDTKVRPRSQLDPPEVVDEALRNLKWVLISDEKDPPPDNISRKYRKGEYLIYDCEGKHWACVNQEGFEKCQMERKEGINSNWNFLSCTAFEKKENLKKCNEFQQKLIDHSTESLFCYHPKYRANLEKKND